MSGWETAPDRPRRGRVAAAVLVAAAAVAVAVGLRGPATPQLAVEQATAPAPDRTAGPGDPATPAAWPPPWPGLWRELPPAPLAARVGHAVAATDRHVVVWGGAALADGRPLPDGAVFDLARGTWRRLPVNGARNSRVEAVWTQRDVVTVSTTETRRWDPVTGSWRTAARVPRPSGRITTQVRAAGPTVVVLQVPPDGTGTAALWQLPAGGASWRRLPAPPVPLGRDDLVLADAERLLVVAAGRPGRPAAAAELRHWRRTPRWRVVPAPPGLTAARVGRVHGALDRGRVLLWGSGRAGGLRRGGAWSAVRTDGRWERIDPGPLPPARAVDVLATGDGVVVWHRDTARGALRRWSNGRWTRTGPPPSTAPGPRPAAWTGSAVVEWGGVDAAGGVFTPR